MRLLLGEWFNGRTAVSKTVDEGSIPSSPAISKNPGIYPGFSLF